MKNFGFPSISKEKVVEDKAEKSLVRGISFPPELWHDIKAESKRRHISMSGIIRLAVVEYIGKSKPTA